jgi:hypothetical protein
MRRIKIFIYGLFGCRVLANHGSREIHLLNRERPNCRIDMIKDYSISRYADKWLERGYNGCRFCFKEKDRG